MAIEVGAKLQGKVSGITNFGAFIDLGEGKTGLVHISEVSNGYVKDIHDVLKVNDEVTVKVTTVGNDGKIGLSIRKADDTQPERPKREFPSNRDNHHSAKPHDNRDNRSSAPRNSAPRKTNLPPQKEDFDSLMSSFLKDSDDRLTSLKRNTEGKRGGRGGRRN
ncbi:S1 domain-containing RNA-binding protein [Enterococcus timonensis]|uniref:S1 domain-containing RNA-binding protein n=1 Tax=Enterococcus timonensis TaxID=1852364 RepID=UPI0008D9BFD0|nr:S1 domain-containing RNA-binding protein [Enterococcus timonensis]